MTRPDRTLSAAAATRTGRRFSARPGRSRARRFAGIVGLLLGAVAGALAPTPRAAATAGAGDVARFVGLPLPPETGGLRTFVEEGVDPVLFARFDLPPDVATGYLAALSLWPLQRGFDPLVRPVGADVTWWRLPLSAQSAGAEVTDYAGRRRLRVVVDFGPPRSFPARWTVFLCVSGAD